MRRILLDADLLIEFVINRSMFQEKVERLLEIINVEGVQFYLSDFGFKKIREIVKVINGQKASREMISSLKKQFKIKSLIVTKPTIDEARLSDIEDFDSSIEVSLAINSNISAIITHKVSNFSGSKLNVCSLTDFQERENLEKIFSKETSDRPMVLDIKDKIASLNYLYALPSYASEESLKWDSPGQKLVNPHDIAHLSSMQDLLLSRYHKSILESLEITMNKGLIENLLITDALRKPVIDSFTTLHPLRDSLISQHRKSIVESSKLTMNKGLIENLLNTDALRKPVIDSFTALHPLRDSLISQHRKSMVESSKLTMDKGLIENSLNTDALRQPVVDSFTALHPLRDSLISQHRKSMVESSKLTMDKGLIENSLNTDALRKPVIDSFTALHPLRDSLISQHRKSMVESSKLTMDKGLIENSLNTDALRKPVIDSFTALHPLRDSLISQHRKSMVESSKLTMDKGLIENLVNTTALQKPIANSLGEKLQNPNR
jgi:hypothetical protein